MPRRENTLTNSPTTADDRGQQGVKGPPNKPGRHEKAGQGRVTKEGYEAGLRPDEPKKRTEDCAPF